MTVEPDAGRLYACQAMGLCGCSILLLSTQLAEPGCIFAMVSCVLHMMACMYLPSQPDCPCLPVS